MHEIFPIAGDPNTPSSSKENLKKIKDGRSCSWHVAGSPQFPLVRPINLQIVPHSDTEVTCEEKVDHILIAPGRTHDTKIVLIWFPPMTSNQHILCVESVKEQQPSKNI